MIIASVKGLGFRIRVRVKQKLVRGEWVLLPKSPGKTGHILKPI